MRILVVQLEGLGNAVLTTPLISALLILGHQVSVVYDYARGSHVAFSDWPDVTSYTKDSLARSKAKFDVALWAHPKWQHAIDDRALQRQYLAIGAGSSSWYTKFTRHEVECLLDLAKPYGWQDAFAAPPTRVYMAPAGGDDSRIAIGIGFYKQSTRAYAKHWGNENFIALCRLLRAHNKTPVIVGSADEIQDLGLSRLPKGCVDGCVPPIGAVVASLNSCCAFVGNDTGLMHVAAALKKPCIAIFRASNIVKSHPWRVPWIGLEGNPSPQLVVSNLESLLCKSV